MSILNLLLRAVLNFCIRLFIILRKSIRFETSLIIDDIIELEREFSSELLTNDVLTGLRH